jgi:hypothetical protein
MLKNKEIQIREPFTFQASGALALRLYPDNRPQTLEIAVLQKGLILLVSGKECVEEGAGFGVPVVKYSNHTYFSGTAEISQKNHSGQEVTFRKNFSMDSVSEKQILGTSIDRDFYAFFHKAFESAYLNLEKLRVIFDLLILLRKTLGLQTRFMKVPSKGNIVVTYHCLPNLVRVHVDFSGLNKSGCHELLILNEQGSSVFKQYIDSNGDMFNGRKIGAWRTVVANVAVLFNAQRHVGFSVRNLLGAILHCGWEQVKGRFSWAGLNYSLHPSNREFTYEISLLSPELLAENSTLQFVKSLRSKQNHQKS